MRGALLAIFIALVLTAFSYFVNNNGTCCDQIFQAGWPFPFYGGSGGFMGIQEDKLIVSGLVLDVIFWFVISIILILALTYKKNKTPA
ncbi:MAG: hypothetical protein HYW86_01555 [Candidatus Roizmanbacteria bacterium]|nr:MAG: hypothetical protein HYW86_01555 [Candidatus Roizmanbacteria bacterium]